MSVRRFCFVIMPFDGSFDPLYDVIKKAINQLGCDCRRADENTNAGNLRDLIVSDIRHADLVVAVTAEANPNVFYEIGIAHAQPEPKPVILVHPAGARMPSDLAGAKWLQYDPKNLAKLGADISEWVRAAFEDAFQENHGMYPSKELRTQEIIRACDLYSDHLANFGPEDLTIRSMAGVASLAISDHESEEPDNYQKWLLDERNCLLRLLGQGAKMRLILHPPTERDLGKPWERLAMRMHRMIGLLEGKSDSTVNEIRRLDKLVSQQCDVTISKSSYHNTLMLGQQKCFEALRRGIGRGFATTYWTTTRSEVCELTQNFDSVYDECQRSVPDNGAAINKLKEAFEKYRQSVGKEWDASVLPQLS